MSSRKLDPNAQKGKYHSYFSLLTCGRYTLPAHTPPPATQSCPARLPRKVYLGDPWRIVAPLQDMRVDMVGASSVAGVCVDGEMQYLGRCLRGSRQGASFDRGSQSALQPWHKHVAAPATPTYLRCVHPPLGTSKQVNTGIDSLLPGVERDMGRRTLVTY